MELDRNLLLFLGESPKPNAFSLTVGIPKNKMSYPSGDFFFPFMGLMDNVLSTPLFMYLKVKQRKFIIILSFKTLFLKFNHSV